MNNFKQLICATISLCFAFMPTIAHGGFSHFKRLPITGSATGATGATYSGKCIVAWEADPIKTGSWTINSKEYNFRIDIPITETTNSSVSEIWPVFINTKYLLDHGYIVSGDEVEFAFDDDVAGIEYYEDTTYFNLERTPYYVPMSQTARQAQTLHCYFDPDITETSDNSVDSSHNGQYSIATNIPIAQDSDDWLNIPTIGCFLTTSTISAGSGRNYNQDYTSGWRFQNVPLPNGVEKKITFGSCYLAFTAHQSAGSLLSNFYGIDADDVAAFSDCTEPTLTTAFLAYDTAAAWTTNSIYNTGDASGILTEIVSRPGWSAGNDLGFIWKNDGSASGIYRTAYQYGIDSSKATQLYINATVTQNWSRMPLIQVPLLYDCDVRLDGLDQSWPFDIEFRDSDKTTVIPCAIDPASEANRLGKTVTFNVLYGAIDQSPATKNIYIFYGDSSVATAPASWSGVNTFTFYDDFESGTGAWTVASGTWAAADQQKAIMKGGPELWSRGHMIAKVGDEWKCLVGEAEKWEDFGWTGLKWRDPQHEALYTSKDKIHWKNYGPVFCDRDSDVPAFEGIYPFKAIASITEHNGVYWILYYNWGGLTSKTSLHLASTTDFITFTYSSQNPIWVRGQDGSPDYPFASAYLMRDIDDTQWILYVAYTQGGNYYVDAVYSTDDGDPDDAAYSYYGHVCNFGVYAETAWVVKTPADSKYTLFTSDVGYDSVWNQRIRYTTPSTDPFSFTDAGRITSTYYELNNQSSGYPCIFYDGSDLYATSFGGPQTAAGLLGTGPEADNFCVLQKITTFPGTWEPQNVSKMIYCSTTNAIDRTYITDVYFGDAKISTSVLLKYGYNKAGVLFRIKDGNNYYYAIFNKTSNTIELHKVIATTDTKITEAELPLEKQESSSAYLISVGCYKDGTDRNIIIDVSESGSVWTNVISTHDESLTDDTWGAGLICLASKAYFDTVAISPYIYPEPIMGQGVSEIVHGPQVIITNIE